MIGSLVTKMGEEVVRGSEANWWVVCDLLSDSVAVAEGWVYLCFRVPTSGFSTIGNQEVHLLDKGAVEEVQRALVCAVPHIIYIRSERPVYGLGTKFDIGVCVQQFQHIPVLVHWPALCWIRQDKRSIGSKELFWRAVDYSTDPVL